MKHKVRIAGVTICMLQGAILIDIIATCHAFWWHALQGRLSYSALTAPAESLFPPASRRSPLCRLDCDASLHLQCFGVCGVLPDLTKVLFGQSVSAVLKSRKYGTLVAQLHAATCCFVQHSNAFRGTWFVAERAGLWCFNIHQ